MRGIIASVSLLLCCTLLGCTESPTGDVPQETISPRTAIQRAAADAFDVSDVVVTAKPGVWQIDAGWEIVVVLDSIESTASIDRAAAQTLAAVATVETSGTPVILSVLSTDLRLPNSNRSWGRLSYSWGWVGRGGSFARGTDVNLLHAEAEAPSDPPRTPKLVVKRGHWQEVDVTTLQAWAEDGAPDPVLLPEDNIR